MVKIDVWQAVLRILDSYLEVNNHRKTPERYTILKAIYKTEGHFTLDELSDRLVQDYNFRVSRATLYNTLNLFLQLRLVVRHRFQGATVYEACYDNMSHSHQICTVCGIMLLKMIINNSADIESFAYSEFTNHPHQLC